MVALAAILSAWAALTPAGGPAGTRTVVIGGGLRPAERIAVVHGRSRLARARADRHGRFAVPVTVPASARGGFGIAVRARRTRVSLAYNVGRAQTGEVASTSGADVRFAPLRASPGTPIQIRAQGLPKRQRVRITLGSATVTARAGKRGTLATGLPMPAGSEAKGAVRTRGVRLPFAVQGMPSSGPIRAAFYYPWFPESWRQRGIYPFTHFHPTAGFYSEDDAATLSRQVGDMLYARIDAGLVSWFGQGTRSDRRLPALLSVARGTPFRWAVYHEGEGHGDPSVDQIRSDLHYIHDRYAGDPAYLHEAGRFVVFVYADANDGPGMAERWHAANDVGAYVVLKVFPGYREAPDQPDSWHQYAPARAQDSQPGYSYSVSPGFWHAAESAPRLARDIDRFRASVRAMTASNAPWQLVTTFNEWGEGTAVEGAQEWASPSGRGAYLDALRDGGR